MEDKLEKIGDFIETPLGYIIFSVLVPMLVSIIVVMFLRYF